MQTIAELPSFASKAEKLLTEPEHQALLAHLAQHPTSGVVLQGTGGIRKLRWARQGSGKRGGTRIIYYYHDARIPLYLLALFGKGEKDNLSQAERNALAKLVKQLLQTSGA